MANILTAAELKRRGMVAIEEGLRAGPLHILKRNKPAAVVLSEEDYSRLVRHCAAPPPDGLTAVQWLLATDTSTQRSKAEIDAELHTERQW
ncbi:MAG: type II toxin-antitoxin system Phd/YefM family antitoxin [Chromatiales bacterium]|nr:type II toxin-antitoxin system Phd/YefM family antitoxin [Gammaproteobacteria bacterium]MBW6477715.1 type II toxin-antitoxin system Phd/YefM family antitoxin [Chromatiales bacterium]